ncbi:MAG: curli production assembly protein CsgG [Bryobacterales bacterium]|nr:curli production assembly protein CsgG [Bryobacterales bacterium]
MRWIKYVLLAAVLVFQAAAQQAPAKRRIAVMNFDYGAVQSGISAIFGANQDVGKGIADLIVEKLVQGGVYTVYERKAIDKIMAEQNFSNSDRADASSAAKIGRLLGVEAIIIGSITQFGRDDKSTSVGGGGYGLGKYGLGGIGAKSSKAVVAVSARMISTDTAEILAAVSGRGESTRSGANLLGAGGSGGSGGGGAVGMNASNFADTILGEATVKAVASITSQLNNNSGSIQARVVKLEGLVADASGGTLVLNIGSKVGVRVGDKLFVKRTGREIRDPASGKVIRRIEESIGEVTITEVDELSAVGNYTGSAPAKTGDTVRN